MNESEKREAEENFWKFMRNSIWYCARNVTRSASAAENRNAGVPLEALSERNLSEYAAVEDRHELEAEIRMIISNVRFALYSEELSGIFEGLTEREKQELILYAGLLPRRVGAVEAGGIPM